MPEIVTSIAGIDADQLSGFFVGWPSPPDPETHLRILEGSFAVALALADERVIGFANAVTPPSSSSSDSGSGSGSGVNRATTSNCSGVAPRSSACL